MVEQNKILENITKQNTTGQNKTEEKWEDLDPEVQGGLRQYFVKQIQDALKNNRYDLATLRIIYYLISNDEKIDHNEPVKPIHYSERILRERAKKLGYTVKRSYVRVIGGEIIYADTECTDRMIAYDLLKDGVPIDGAYKKGETVPRMNLPTLARQLKKIYEASGLEW